MGKSKNKTGKDDNATNIISDFKNRKSNEFYRYYYWKQSDLINCWDQLLHCYYNELLEHGTSRWVFRGDVAVCDQKRSMEEAFKTSLDKAFKEFDTPDNARVEEETLRNQIEKRILRAFRRRAHLLTDDKDPTQNHLETFALSRHHGGPARILDWMYSFFPAVYLAINRYDEGDKYTVWALNNKWLNSVSELVEEAFFRKRDYLLYHFGHIKKKQKHAKRETKEYSEIRRKLEYYRQYNNNQLQSLVITYLMNENTKSLIYAANPYRLNERLAAQRGVLLFSGTVEKTWGQNLLDTIIRFLQERPDKRIGREIKGPILWEIPLKLSKQSRNEFLRRLDEMNINQATLFPDLDGFAESLRTRIAHPESLGIDVQ